MEEEIEKEKWCFLRSHLLMVEASEPNVIQPHRPS